jgi:HSP20 family protein
MKEMARNLPSLWGTSFPTTFPFGDFRREFDRLFDDFGVSRGGGTNWSVPATEVSEDEKAYYITAELPGLEKDNIEIAVNDDVLSIKAEKKAEASRSEGSVHFSERRYGTYRRDFRLADNVDTDNVAADFKNGVLKLTLPKKEPAQPAAKRIEIGQGK